MKATPTFYPPQATASHSEPALIGVHVRLDPIGHMPFFFPRENLIGAALVKQILESALARSGELVSGGGIPAGELNDSVYLVRVRSVAAARESIQQELSESAIGGSYTVATHTGEGWVELYPNAGRSANYAFDNERIEHVTQRSVCAAENKLIALIEQTRAMLASLGDSAPAELRHCLSILEEQLREIRKVSAELGDNPTETP